MQIELKDIIKKIVGFRDARYEMQYYNPKDLFLSAPTFLGPLATIVILLVLGYSVTFTAFWAIINLIVLSLIRKQTRPSLNDFVEGFKKGALTGAGIAAIIGTVGIIYSTFTYSGLGIKLAGGISYWSSGYLMLALIIIAAISVFFGMVGVGGASYIIVSIFGAPALMKMGVEFAVAHFFILYACSFSMITPPIAPGAIIASKIASASYMKTATEGTKVAIAGLLLPYAFVYAPVLLLLPQNSLFATLSIIGAVLFLICLQISFVGMYVETCSLFERLLVFIVAMLLMAFILLKSYLLFPVAIVIFAVSTIWQIQKWRLRTSQSAVKMDALVTSSRI